MSKTQRDEVTIVDYNAAKQSVANSNAGTLLYICITVISTEREAQRMYLFLFRDDRFIEDDSELVNT